MEEAMDGGVAFWLPVIPALVGAGGVVIAALVALRGQRHKLEAELAAQRGKLEQELQTQRERLKTEFATEGSVETALRHFLEIDKMPYRSFPMIRHHIGGFESNELRRLLVRSGAVRFMAADGAELWALRERVPDQFKAGRWKTKEATQNRTDKGELFPGAFDDPGEF